MNYLTRKKYFNMILLFSMIGLFLIIRVNWISSVKAATFAEAIDSFTTGTVGKKASDLGLPSGENWCGYYARYVLENVYAQYGCDVNDYIPYDSLASTTLTGNTWKNGVYGEYYSWTNWTYSGRSSSITSNLSACRPKAGDIVLVETAGGISDGPDHIALIVEADLNGNRFITAEGNTGSGTTSTRVVRWYDYVYNNDSGYYCRDGNSNIIVHAICSIRYPGNQGNQGNQSNQGHSPVGHVDSVSCEDGKICLAGWAFDEDAYYENLQIIVNIDYIEEYILEANGYRPDVNEAYQNVPGVNHGFEGEIYPAQRGLKNVVIYAVDMGGNSVCDNTILWEGPLEIKDDTTPPTIEDVYIHDIDANGYYIHCIVRDNVGLREVEFPTWTLENKNASGDDQDDIIWGNAGTVSGNGWELDYRVNYSDHKNELDCTYATHIYCYDMSGNEGIYAISQYACNGSVMTSGYGRVIPDGDYIVATACSGSKADLYYLDIVGTDLPANDGTNVALAGPISTLEDPQSYDVWTLTYGSDGFYSIKQKGSEVSLDVANASAGSGANIQAYNSNSSNAQRWAISNNGRDGYRIQGKCSGLSIVAEDNRAAGGTNIHQYINMDIPGESWLFIPYKPSQPIANGRYMLISGLSDSVEVDVPGDTGDITENLGLQIWSTDTQNQYNSFNLTKLSNGFYKIQHAASGKCWDVTNGVSSFSQQIALHTDNGSIAQQWAIISKGNNLYAIISRCNGLTADVHGGTTSNGTRIIQFPNGEGSNQRWKFVQAEYTVAFNANGGAGVPASQTKYYNNNLTLSSTKPTLTGYTFQSWNTKADGTGTNYAAGGSYTTNADVTLYAMWKKQDEEPPIITGGNLEILSDTLCRFTVTATDNIGIDHVDIHTWYGDYSGSGDTVYKATKSGNDWYYDVPCNLTNNTVRWMDARVFDASGNQALVSGLTILVGKLKYVDITFDANEGFCSVASKKVIWAEYINRLKGNTFVSNYGQLPIPERRGYSFTGWYTEQTGGTKVEESTPVTRNESYTLYAHWNKIEPDFILPAALTTIEEEAFKNCSFIYVKLSENTTSIGSKAFSNCQNLRHIYIPEATSSISKDAFDGVDKSITIHGVDDSYAKFYADKYGYRFEAE